MTKLLKGRLATLIATLFAASLLVPVVSMAAPADAAADQAKDATAAHDNKAKHPLKQKIDNVKEKMDAAQEKRKEKLDASEE